MRFVHGGSRGGTAVRGGLLAALVIVALAVLAACGGGAAEFQHQPERQRHVAQGHAAQAASSSANNLRVASDIPYMPWEGSVGRHQPEPTGFDYDLSQALAPRSVSPSSFNETQVRQHHPLDPVGQKRRGHVGHVRQPAAAEGARLRRLRRDGTSILVLKGNRRASSASTAWPARQWAVRTARRSRRCSTAQQQFQAAGKAR